MKENLKPCVYKLWEYNVCVHTYMYNRVLFVERSGELRGLARLRTSCPEPKGNQVLIEQAAVRWEATVRWVYSQSTQTRNRVTYPCPG